MNFDTSIVIINYFGQKEESRKSETILSIRTMDLAALSGRNSKIHAHIKLSEFYHEIFSLIIFK